MGGLARGGGGGWELPPAPSLTFTAQDISQLVSMTEKRVQKTLQRY